VKTIYFKQINETIKKNAIVLCWKCKKMFTLDRIDFYAMVLWSSSLV